MIDTLIQIFGPVPHGLTFLYYIIGGLLLVFVFHLIEHIFEILFSRFFK